MTLQGSQLKLKACNLEHVIDSQVVSIDDLGQLHSVYF